MGSFEITIYLVLSTETIMLLLSRIYEEVLQIIFWTLQNPLSISRLVTINIGSREAKYEGVKIVKKIAEPMRVIYDLSLIHI